MVVRGALPKKTTIKRFEIVFDRFRTRVERESEVFFEVILEWFWKWVTKKTTIKRFGVVLDRFWKGFEKDFEVVLNVFRSGFGGALPM